MVGLIAGLLTTACWIPQLRKSWKTRSLHDLSWHYLVTLAAGVMLWVAYGFEREDGAIIATNVITLTFLGVLIWLKTSTEPVDLGALDD